MDLIHPLMVLIIVLTWTSNLCTWGLLSHTDAPYSTVLYTNSKAEHLLDAPQGEGESRQSTGLLTQSHEPTGEASQHHTICGIGLVSRVPREMPRLVSIASG